MHYFWRGDMTHFSSPLPFQRAPVGAGQRRSPDPRGGRAVDLSRPERGSRGLGPRRSPDPHGRGAPSISAGMAPLAGAGQRTPLQMEGQPGTARAAQVRRGVTAAISNWPAPPAVGQPQQARPPRRLRPCPIFTLLLILLTTPS